MPYEHASSRCLDLSNMWSSISFVELATLLTRKMSVIPRWKGQQIEWFNVGFIPISHVLLSKCQSHLFYPLRHG